MSHRHYVFTIPKALRGLLQRERQLLGILSRSAYEAVRKTFAAALGRKDVVPGFVAAIQTFGAYGPNFHPHLHAIVSEGAFSPQGEFLPIPSPDPTVIAEVFRREVLDGMVLKSNRFGFEPEIIAKLSRLNLNIYEVPVSYYGRTYAEGKKIGWRDGVRAFWCIFKYNLLK